MPLWLAPEWEPGAGERGWEPVPGTSGLGWEPVPLVDGAYSASRSPRVSLKNCATDAGEELSRWCTMTASISSRIAAAEGVRRAGSFTRARRMRSDTSCGMCGLSCEGTGAGSRTMAASVAASWSRRNGSWPVSSSKRTTPSAKTSLRQSSGRPLAASGDR
ncbi:hypothetical protein COSO111634_37895 [Corallococcus soli]